MNTSSTKSTPEFMPRSLTESICMYCFLTVRVKRPEDLANEECEHGASCIERLDYLRKRQF